MEANRMTLAKRALGALAVGALALPFLVSPALAAPGDTPIPPARSITTFCANPTAAQFTDIMTSGDANAVELALAVRCIATAGITTGVTATTYAPQANVTRRQMASFIARLVDASSAREVNEAAVRELPAPPATSPFVDVPRDNTELTNNILRLQAAGIVDGNPGTPQQPSGIGANRFGPDLNVTRSQMAAFINRAVAYMTSNATPAQVRSDTGTSLGFSNPNAEYYVDPQQAVHVRNVNGITSAGIAQGVGNKRYDGLGNVTRQQMARFLARTLSTLFTSDAPGGVRIVGLNNALSANFDDASRVMTATRLGSATPLSSSTPATAANSRTFTATGLAAGVEYRITLVNAGVALQPGQTNTGDLRFTTGGAATGSNGLLVNTGITTATNQAVITSVNGATPVNNTAAGATPTTATASATAVFTPGTNGTVTFTIVGASGQAIIPVIYRNGQGTQSSYTTGGGADFRLEVDANGRPIERFGHAGATTFQ
jgi:hypothetical protein